LHIPELGEHDASRGKKKGSLQEEKGGRDMAPPTTLNTRKESERREKPKGAKEPEVHFERKRSLYREKKKKDFCFRGKPIAHDGQQYLDKAEDSRKEDPEKKEEGALVRGLCGLDLTSTVQPKKSV